ncbi:GNAT family N-acetyltransferase [Phaeobacter sp.]|uniref:GNAT family N-acetyltransferase n=1 Tax=Phaeobacter sp. TaxID=1902409 RepID=UPI0025E4F85E|nr:GNAT family N-acetyltransferase [Phaeobacter sp.]
MAQIHAAAFLQARPWSEAEFQSLLDSSLTYAVGDDRCFAIGRVVADEAELITIATHPDHQRQGHATRCLAEWKTCAAARGATVGFLEVAADNTAAQILYRANGFAESGRRARYYARKDHPPVDAILMSATFR